MASWIFSHASRERKSRSSDGWIGALHAMQDGAASVVLAAEERQEVQKEWPQWSRIVGTSWLHCLQGDAMSGLLCSSVLLESVLATSASPDSAWPRTVELQLSSLDLYEPVQDDCGVPSPPQIESSSAEIISSDTFVV